MAEITEQIVREAPGIEKYKLDLLETAKQQVQQPLNLPAYQAAGISDIQRQAINLGQQGIGAYAPFIQAGQGALESGIGTLGRAGQAITGLDISPQYTTALQGVYGAQGTAGLMAGGAGAVGAAAQQLPGYMQAGLTPSQVMLNQAAQATMEPSSFAQPGVSTGLMSPYMQDVVAIQQREALRQGDIARQSRAAQAAKAGSFGGTREAVVEAEAQRNLAQQLGDIQAAGLQQAFQQAQQQFNTEQQARLAASGQLAGIGGTLGQQALSQAQLGQAGVGLLGQLGTTQSSIYGQQAGLQNQLAQGIGSLASQYGQFGLQRGVALSDIGQNLGAAAMNQAQLGQAAQGMGQADVNALMTLGGLQQATEQARLDAARATALQEATSPYQRIAFLSDIYKSAPSTQMSVTGATAPTTSPLVQAAGLGIAGLAAASGAKRAGIF